MKKIQSILITFCLILSLIINMQLITQALEVKIEGSSSKITYSQISNNEEIRIFTSLTKITKKFVLPPDNSNTYYRICFEIEGYSVPRTVKADINQGSIKQIRLANFTDPVRTSVVVETKVKPDYSVVPASDGKSVVLTIKDSIKSSTTAPSASPKPTSTPKPSVTPAPTVSQSPLPTQKPANTSVPASNATGSTGAVKSNGPLSWSLSGDICTISFSGIALSQTALGNLPRYEIREKEKILQVTIPGKDTRFKNGFLSGNSIIYGILVNYNEKSNTTIIRISYKNTISVAHSISNGTSMFNVKSGNTSVPVPTAPATSTPKPSASPVPTKTPVTSATPAPVPNSGLSIIFNTTSVTVSGTGSTKVYRLGNPSRIVIETAGKTSPTEKIMPAGSLYNRAAITQASANTVKVELFTQSLPDWSITQSTGKTDIILKANAITNIQGGNGDSYVALRLSSPGIVNLFRQYGKDIIADDNTSSGTYTIKIPKSIVSLGEGQALIEDGLTKSIVVISTQTDSFLMLNKVDASKKFSIIEGSSSNELLIVTGSSSNGSGSSNNSKLVVLDPGHGGYDPGGTVGSNYEKKYNLDISLRCEAILKSKGVNVILTRTTDVFIGLEERAQFANDRNASLFVSVHNNIMPKDFKGSMTFYYSTSYVGKEYAKIIQNNLIKDLNTANIGVRASSDLVVIKKTKMPAVLAEIACMSDSGDLALLNTDVFIQKAAESLANSIIQILGTM